MKDLLGSEQRLQIGHQKQDARIMQCRQLVVQFSVQNFVRSPCFLQLLSALGNLNGIRFNMITATNSKKLHTKALPLRHRVA